MAPRSYRDYLAGASPYLTADAEPGPMLFSEAAIGRAPLRLDPSAVIAYLRFSYLLGDRTLARGVRRAPWLHRWSEGRWNPLRIPEHGTDRPDPRDTALRLKKLLEQESRQYTDGARSIAILLSGGMDSRLAASILHAVQRESGRTFTVSALTWGLPRSRDVSYARDIARALGWDWHHLELSPERLHANLLWTGREGCEVAPTHLHAILDVNAVADFDVVIAGSYGDSMGRAEFSGVRLTGLRGHESVPADPFGLLRGGALEGAGREIRADLLAQRSIWPGRTELAIREAGQQIHYMRRKFQAVMASALAPTPVRQMFTSPEIVSLMWGLDPAVRDDRYYRILSEDLPRGLADLPWARTGRRFGGEGSGGEGSAAAAGGDADGGLTRQFHCYGVWLREDLGSEIARRAGSDRVLGTGLFNEASLRRLLSVWRRGRTATVGRIDEIVSWLAGLDVFLETYDVRTEDAAPLSAGDRLRGCRGTLHACAHTLARNLMRE